MTAPPPFPRRASAQRVRKAVSSASRPMSGDLTSRVRVAGAPTTRLSRIGRSTPFISGDPNSVMFTSWRNRPITSSETRTCPGWAALCHPRGDVGCVAEQRQVAPLFVLGVHDDRESGMDAHPHGDGHRQVRRIAFVDQIHCPADVESRLHRPVGIVFVGNRVTELGQNPVTGIVGNTAPIGQHDPTADLLVLEKQVGIVLGIDHLAQLGRADQITEEQHEESALPPRRTHRFFRHVRALQVSRARVLRRPRRAARRARRHAPHDHPNRAVPTSG